MSDNSESVIRRLIERVTGDAGDATWRDGASAAKALPVYLDMGGALALTPQGKIIRYEFESGRASIADECWQVLGLSHAARKYPELAYLKPARPRDASTCIDCSGTGRITAGFECATCLGLGWVVD